MEERWYESVARSVCLLSLFIWGILFALCFVVDLENYNVTRVMCVVAVVPILPFSWGAIVGVRQTQRREKTRDEIAGEFGRDALNRLYERLKKEKPTDWEPCGTHCCCKPKE